MKRLEAEKVLLGWRPVFNPEQAQEDVVRAVIEVKISPEQIWVIIEFPVSLASFDLKPPSVMGIIRVADEVRVEVQTTLHRQITTEAPASVKEK